jgi:hypothetical protein
VKVIMLLPYERDPTRAVRTSAGTSPKFHGPRSKPRWSRPAPMGSRNLALPGMLESNAITQEETLMRTLLLAGVLAVAGFAIATPISIAPASAQVAVDTPLGGVRVGPQPRYSRDYDRDYDRPAYRAYGYDRGYRGCRTVTIERDDGSVRRVRRCD